MSASQHAPDLRAKPVVPARFKQAGRALLSPLVRLAMALHLTPNTITVIGLGITIVAALLIANDLLLIGAAVLVFGRSSTPSTAGSLEPRAPAPPSAASSTPRSTAPARRWPTSASASGC